VNCAVKCNLSNERCCQWVKDEIIDVEFLEMIQNRYRKTKFEVQVVSEDNTLDWIQLTELKDDPEDKEKVPDYASVLLLPLLS